MARLVVVDDDKEARDSLCRYLATCGHELECFENGKEALHSLLEKTPDLLLLDLLMPEMDGLAFLEIIRAYLHLSSLPVIVLTGLADSPLIERARSLKVNAILVKGKALPEDIAAAIEQELHRMPV